MYQQTKFGGNWITEWDFKGLPKKPYFGHFCDFLTSLKPPNNAPLTPTFFLWTLFGSNTTIFHFENV